MTDPWAELRAIRDTILAELGDSPGEQHQRLAIMLAWDVYIDTAAE